MKVSSIIAGVCFLALCCIAGCDNYERKGIVTPEITANTQALNLFVGGTEQLIVSPAGLNFTWMSEDPEVATVDGNGLVSAVSDGNTFIVARSGDMSCKVPITVVTRIRLTDFRLSVTDLEMRVGNKLSAVVIPIPENANDASLPTWSSLNAQVASVDYKGEITAQGEGDTKISCTINGIVKNVNVNVSGILTLTSPFKGPHVLSAANPYTLLAINFDYGGEGFGYHDADTGNSGGNGYRAENGDPNGGGVDIGGDLAVGWTSGGEWLLYTIEVQDAGEYYLSLDASVNSASAFRIDLMEGSGVFVRWTNLTGTVNIKATGGWSNWWWIDLGKSVTLSAGEQKIRYYFENANFNLRNLRFTHTTNDVPIVKSILTGAGKKWKIGPWTAMRDPNNRGSSWWNFKDASIMNDVFTFNSNGSFIYENNGDSFMNESLGDLFQDGNTAGSFVTNHYTPSADASWDVSRINGMLILTINKGFFGYATSPGDLVKAQYAIVPDYSGTSLKLIHYPDGDSWCYEIVPDN